MSSSNVLKPGGGQPWEAKPFEERKLGAPEKVAPRAERNLFFELESTIKEVAPNRGYRDWTPERSQKSAEQWLAEIEEKARMAEKMGYEEGLKKGRSEGNKAGKKELCALASEFLEAISKLSSQKEELLKKVEGELLDLALAAAKKIVGQELSLHKDASVSIVKAAVGAAVDRERLRVKVNPSFLNAIAAHKPNLQKYLEGAKNIRLDEDPTLEPGDCVIETLYGSVDARIDSQLEQIRDSVLRNAAECRQPANPSGAPGDG